MPVLSPETLKTLKESFPLYLKLHQASEKTKPFRAAMARAAKELQIAGALTDPNRWNRTLAAIETQHPGWRGFTMR